MESISIMILMRIVNVLVGHDLPLFSTLTKNITYTHKTNKIYKIYKFTNFAVIKIHFGKFSFRGKIKNKVIF